MLTPKASQTMIGVAIAFYIVPAIPAVKIFYFSFEINGHKIYSIFSYSCQKDKMAILLGHYGKRILEKISVEIECG